MSNTETTDSPRVQLVRSYCEGFSKKDMDHIGKLLHKDHRRVTYPRSLGKADQTKEEYLKQLAQGMSTWTENEMIIHSITETAGEQVVTHLTCRAKTSLGVDMSREMILTAQIVADEDGSLKFKQLDEFTDSKAYLDFFQAIASAMRKQ